ncbi:hypothetical protein NC651_024746 [Populus alba x Populus x berolinensis]|nr:hypothetical protein NC651_024746 [Populus alba x Populus x berolinensis]
MDLVAIVTALCICLSILLVTPSAAMEIHEKQSSHQHAADDRIKFSVPTLPRKLRVLLDQEVAVCIHNEQQLNVLASLLVYLVSHLQFTDFIILKPS